MEKQIAELLERHRAFWRREKVEQPLVTVQRYSPLAPTPIPLADGTRAEGELHLRPELLRAADFVDLSIYLGQPGRLLLGGSFAVRAPYYRIPWIEAILGCPIWGDRVSGSMWSEPCLTDLRQTGNLALQPDNAWYQKLQGFTRALVENNDGTYLVAQTSIRGPIDMVRALLGDEAMCLALYDAPGAVRDLLEATTDVYVEVIKGQQELIPPFHGGHCSPFGIWAPGTFVRTQCDMSAVLSPRMYAEIVVPFEEKICRQFDYSVIHLHSGYLHTVDALLASELPLAIEIALDTGSTPVTPRDLVPICRKILARKPLLLEGHLAATDLAYLLQSLPARGLYIRADLDEIEQ